MFPTIYLVSWHKTVPLKALFSPLKSPRFDKGLMCTIVHSSPLYYIRVRTYNLPIVILRNA